MKPLKVRVVREPQRRLRVFGQNQVQQVPSGAGEPESCDISDSVSRSCRLLQLVGSVGNAGSSFAQPPLVREGPPGDSATTHGYPEGIWTRTNSLF